MPGKCLRRQRNWRGGYNWPSVPGGALHLAPAPPFPSRISGPLLQELYDGVAVAPELNSSDNALVDGLRQGRYQIVVTHEPPPQEEELFCFPTGGAPQPAGSGQSPSGPADRHPGSRPGPSEPSALFGDRLLDRGVPRKTTQAHFLFMNEWMPLENWWDWAHFPPL